MNPTPLPLCALVVAALVAGCIDDAVPAANPPSEPLSAEAAGPAPPTSFEWGLLGPTVTREGNATVYAATDGILALTLRANGTTLFAGTLEGNASWTVPLEHGRTLIEVVADQPAGRVNASKEVTRLAPSALRVEYGVYHPSYTGTNWAEDHAIWFDVDSRPALSQYAARGLKHERFTAHDHLVLFEQATGKKVEYGYSTSLQQFSVNRIDGAGNPVTASSPPWWCYKVNGRSADGISIQPIQPGDRVVWNLGTCT